MKNIIFKMLIAFCALSAFCLAVSAALPRFLFNQHVRLAGRGDCAAQEKVADAYQNGTSVTKNLQKAADGYRAAFACGRVSAAYKLAELYGNTPDGKDFLIRAALAGHSTAAVRLVSYYGEGDGLLFPQNEDAAWFWTFVSAQDNEEAKNRLEQLQQNDEQRYRMIKSVFDTYTRSRAGGALALQQMGNHFEFGGWLEPNASIARTYYEKAMERGSFAAEYFLGLMRMEGHGFEKNETLGLQKIQTAAAKKVPEALLFLGRKAYEEKDFQTAEHYFKAAAEIEDPEALAMLQRLQQK